MKDWHIRLSLLFSISLLILTLACKSAKKQAVKEDEVLVQPKPLMDTQVDSLKNYLDEKRKSKK
jgi:hypothetical protein